MLEMLGDFVRVESPSDHPDDTRRMGERAVAALTESAVSFLAGAEADLVPGDGPGAVARGPHRRIRLPGAEAGARPLLLLGHLDTVWERGTLDELPWRIEDGIARGPGVYDMKAGLVQTIWALRSLDRRGLAPRRPVTVVWNTDEEVGSGTSADLIAGEATGCAACLVMEPSLPGGGAKTMRRGVGVLEVRVEGRAAHAGLDPERGISAVAELSRIVLAAEALGAPERGLTVNVGLFRGGTRSNVIPALATATVDVRMDDPAAGEALIASLRGLGGVHPKTRVTWTGGTNRPPLVRTPEVAALYRRARRIAASLDWELGEGGAGGGSDGNIAASVGAPVLDGLGPEGDGAHARREHVRVDDLPRRAALLAALLTEL